MKIVKITLNEISELIKKSINENYPLGAADDPRAPWNEKTSAEFEGDFDLEPDICNNSICDIIINLYKSDAKAKIYFSKILEKFDENGEIADAIDPYIQNTEIFYKNLDDVEKIIEPLLNDFYNSYDVEWEDNEPYEPEYEKD